MKKKNNPLFKLFVPYNAHHLEKDSTGEWKWVTVVIEVEVLTLNLRTGSMRVRSVEKIAWDTDDKPEIRAFDLPIDDFFKSYKIVPVN